jgi:hypothetical protein
MNFDKRLEVIVFGVVIFILAIIFSALYTPLKRLLNMPIDLSENNSTSDVSTKNKIDILFPVNDSVPERMGKIGLLINNWRKAIIDKNINEIKQLNIGIMSFGQDGVPFLRKLVIEDSNERVRAFAARVLGGMNFNESYFLFINLLKNDKSSFVRENASWALGKLGNMQTIEILQRVADSDESEKVREVAKESIKAIQSVNNGQKGENVNEHKTETRENTTEGDK